ncbi:alpha/beta hydrolase [Enterococcus xiangfangensis]|uniref:alpha/beta hydrolase n=1 Tax=Enterococcus xiangfangensis TaxID=1296537 RepID=UPI0010FA59EB|nr:alpha/beta hydrolase family protein [Enterococcus xiangfangensis]MBM7712684.1 putative tributyrin esterase [Enterococcus xiangfangensis]NBK09825.1 esterase family protein [Enterococcus asini]
MAFLQVNVYSNVLQMEVMVNVILPQTTHKKIGTATTGATEDVSVLYLLHGMGGNHSVWERRTSIERYVADYQMAVVMPSTDLGFYTNTTYDMNYWTFISEELPEIVHELFPQITDKREKTFAAGLSMGGYGALKLGLAKSENFAAVASLSGAVVLSDVKSLLTVRNEAYWQGIFGPLDQIQGSKNDPLYLLEELVNSQKPAPRFFLACGTEDDLYPASQYMAHKLKQKELAVTFEEGPGKHDWVFWDTWIERVLEWFNEKSD